MSGNQSSSLNPTAEVPPPPEQPTVLDPTPEPPVQDNLLTSETIPPPEQFADREQSDPPRNEVPQPDPANFKVRKLFLSLRPLCLEFNHFSAS